MVIKNGYDVNHSLVKNGHAWVYDWYYKGTKYKLAEEKAKIKKIGLWHQKAPIAP